MLGTAGARAAVGRFWAPVVRGLVRVGVTADAVTLTGTLGAVASAAFLIGNGELFWGAFAVTVFVLLDMLDGALARARGGGSVFGAVLDSTGDRAADAAIFAALAWWFSGAGARAAHVSPPGPAPRRPASAARAARGSRRAPAAAPGSGRSPA